MPGVGVDSARAAFRALNYEPSQDVLGLYAQIGGMQSPDQHDWRLWPLDEVLAENANSSDRGVYFSDYLVGCCCFLLSKGSAADTIMVDYMDGSEPQRVASSLEEFLSAQMTAPQVVLDPRSLKVTS